MEAEVKKIFIVILVVIAFQKWDAISAAFSPSQSASNTEAHSVILYATSWCGYCAKTRELLNKNDIKYFEYDVEKSAEGREQRKKLGGNGVPVLVINGEVVKGYNPTKILELVNKKI